MCSGRRQLAQTFPVFLCLNLLLKMPQTEMASEKNARETVSVSEMSDQDILIQYCLQNKVNKNAVDELLKRGFDSLKP